MTHPLVETKLKEFDGKFGFGDDASAGCDGCSTNQEIRQSHREILQSSIQEALLLGRKEGVELAEGVVIGEIRHAQPILWNDDAGKHNRNIGASEALTKLEKQTLSALSSLKAGLTKEV